MRAQRFGWTRRDRTFWGHGPQGSFIDCYGLADPLDLRLQWEVDKHGDYRPEVIWESSMLQTIATAC